MSIQQDTKDHNGVKILRTPTEDAYRQHSGDFLTRGAGYFSLGFGSVSLWKSTRVPWSTLLPGSLDKAPGKHYFWLGMYMFSTGSQILSTVHPEEGQTDREFLDSTRYKISRAFGNVGDGFACTCAAALALHMHKTCYSPYQAGYFGKRQFLVRGRYEAIAWLVGSGVFAVGGVARFMGVGYPLTYDSSYYRPADLGEGV